MFSFKIVTKRLDPKRIMIAILKTVLLVVPEHLRHTRSLYPFFLLNGIFNEKMNSLF